MITTTEESIIIQKTRELCQTILDQPEFKEHRRGIEAFMANEALQGQYQNVLEKRDQLQQKQQMGLPMTGEEVTAFEELKDTLLQNPLVQQFHDAQEALQQVHSSVNQYVEKTLQLGRLPEASDFESGCGEGCGCHH